MPSSVSNLLSHTASCVPMDNAMYSDSVLDLEKICCLLLDHVIAPLARLKR
jgi:hypothetical protein